MTGVQTCALPICFGKSFSPVELSKREAEVLNAKLSRLDGLVDDAGSLPTRKRDISRTADGRSDAVLKPERYDESEAKREVRLQSENLMACLPEIPI